MKITRREWLGAVSTAPLLANKAGKPKPNIIFILSDDHHYQCLGAAGNPYIQTPNLDRLAKRGVNFTSGIISTPQCCPSRGILLSGLETYQSGLLSNGETGFRQGFGPTAIEQLRRGGYDTALIGKWHIRQGPEECGFTKGPLWLREGGSVYRDPKLRRGLEAQDETIPGHITDLFTDAALKYIRSARQPFLLWLAYNAPHGPRWEEERYQRLYRGKNPIAPPAHPPGSAAVDWAGYYSTITHLDEAVGRVIAELEKAALWENSLIVFLGDNGLMFNTKGVGGKVVPWEESIRVPYLVAGGMVKDGLRLQAPVASVDLPATWLDLAGIFPAYRLAGRSLRSYLTTGTGIFEAAFATWADGRAGALVGDLKTVVEPYRLVRTPRYKLIRWQSGKQALYDLQQDPAEDRDLIEEAKYAEIRGELRERLVARMKETDDSARQWA